LLFTEGVFTDASSSGRELGNDIITAKGGNNVILAGAGSDTVTIGDGVDVVLGDTGKVVFEDRLLKHIVTSNEGAGIDSISSGAGNDVVFSGLGSDVVNSGSGDDIVIADTGSLTNNSSKDIVVLINNGVDPVLGGNDIVYLGAGDDIGLGGAGDDVISGQQGGDVIFGDFVEVNISSFGVRDFQSILPSFGGSDTLSGGGGFDILVGGNGFDYFDGRLTTDIIIGNYGRTKDSADAESLLIVSDPTGRDVISSSLFGIYEAVTSSELLQPSVLFVDGGGFTGVPLRTNTALRLTSLLNREDMAQLSDIELKEFLRNLPLITAESSRSSGNASRFAPTQTTTPEPGEPVRQAVPATPGEPAVPGAADGEGNPTNPALPGTVEGEGAPTNLAAPTVVEGEGTPINPAVPTAAETETMPTSAFYTPLIFDPPWVAESGLQNNNQAVVPEEEAERSPLLEASMPESFVAGLLFVANVAGQRGWKLSRLSDEEKVIQGDLEKLRKMQSSRKYSIWQKQDVMENNLN